MDDGKIEYADLDARLATMADPFIAARIAAEVVIEDVQRLQFAVGRSPKTDPLFANMVRHATARLPNDIERLRRFLTDEVWEAAVNANPEGAEHEGIAKECHLDIAWRAGCNWMEALLLYTSPRMFTDWTRPGDHPTVTIDPDTAIQNWDRLCEAPLRGKEIDPERLTYAVHREARRMAAARTIEPDDRSQVVTIRKKELAAALAIGETELKKRIQGQKIKLAVPAEPVAKQIQVDLAQFNSGEREAIRAKLKLPAR